MTIKFARSAAATIEYRVLGNGPSIVLLPSLGRGAEDYNALSEMLAAQGFQVILPQPRGIGGSEGAMTGLCMRDFADDIINVLDAEKLARAVIAGHAYGNFVARMTAVAYPERVAGVAILAGSAGKTADGKSPYRKDILESIYKSSDFSLSESERLRHLQNAFFAPGNDARVWLGGWHARTKTAQKAAQDATPVDDFFLCGAAPVLDLQAWDDTVAERQYSSVLKDALGKRVTVAVIKNAGHALIPEQPREVCRHLSLWARTLSFQAITLECN